MCNKNLVVSFENELTFFRRWIIRIRFIVEPISQFLNVIFVVNLFKQNLNRNDSMKRSISYFQCKQKEILSTDVQMLHWIGNSIRKFKNKQEKNVESFCKYTWVAWCAVMELAASQNYCWSFVLLRMSRSYTLLTNQMKKKQIRSKYWLKTPFEPFFEILCLSTEGKAVSGTLSYCFEVYFRWTSINQSD